MVDCDLFYDTADISMLSEAPPPAIQERECTPPKASPKRAPLKQAASNGHGTKTPMKQQPPKRNRTQSQNGAVVNQDYKVIPMVHIKSSKITLDRADANPISNLLNGNDNLAWYPFVDGDDPTRKAVFKLTEATHYGIKSKEDWGWSFPMTRLGTEQWEGMLFLTDFLENVQDHLDLKPIFGVELSELKELIGDKRSPLFRGYVQMKMKDKVRAWTKEGKLMKDWYQKAITGNLKATKGTYNVLFTGGIYLCKTNDTILLGTSFTVTDIRFMGPIVKGADEDGYDSFGYLQPSVCPC